MSQHKKLFICIVWHFHQSNSVLLFHGDEKMFIHSFIMSVMNENDIDKISLASVLIPNGRTLN